MVHAQVSDEYVPFALIYTTDHIFSVLTINHLVNQYGEPITPHKLATDIKPSVSNLCVLLCPYVIQKTTKYVDTKVLNMHHHSQNCFRGIFVGILQHQKGYPVYVPITWKIFSLHDIIFDENDSSVIAYMSHPYSEALDMRISVSYILYAISFHEQTGDIITFAHFKEGV